MIQSVMIPIQTFGVLKKYKIIMFYCLKIFTYSLLISQGVERVPLIAKNRFICVVDKIVRGLTLVRQWGRVTLYSVTGRMTIVWQEDDTGVTLNSSRKYPYPSGGILEFRMHGGGSLVRNSECMGGCWDWNSECMRGFLVLEFRRGGGLKTLIYWLLKFGKPVLYACVMNKLSCKGMTMKLGCTAYLELPWNACFWQLFQWSFRWLIHC